MFYQKAYPLLFGKDRQILNLFCMPCYAYSLFVNCRISANRNLRLTYGPREFFLYYNVHRLYSSPPPPLHRRQLCLQASAMHLSEFQP